MLLPMLQSWLRRVGKQPDAWERCAASFKQCCGLATDLVVEFLAHLRDEDGPDGTDALVIRDACTLMLKGVLLVLVECVIQPVESIARLGCACIRHLFTSSGPLLSEAQWWAVVAALHLAAASSLQPLRQLLVAFRPGSHAFYGDVGQVKVAARRDTTPEQCLRLAHLAHQVGASNQNCYSVGSLKGLIGRQRQAASGPFRCKCALLPARSARGSEGRLSAPPGRPETQRLPTSQALALRHDNAPAKLPVQCEYSAGDESKVVAGNIVEWRRPGMEGQGVQQGRIDIPTDMNDLSAKQKVQRYAFPS